MDATFLEDRQTPAALQTLLSDVLFADASPEDIVVRETLPSSADLRGATQRRGIEVAENFKRDFAREDGEGIDTDKVGQLLAQERQL